VRYNEKVLEGILLIKHISDKPSSNRLGTNALSKICRQGQIKLPANTNLKRK